MRNKARRRLLAEINVVPYIDVMLVLLIIFMITAPMLTQGVKVNLPSAKAESMVDSQIPVIVTVDRLGQYYVNLSPTPQVPVDAQQMVNLVAAEEIVAKQKNQELPVYVKGDKDADYGTVVEAMVLLQQAGAGTVGLMTRTPGQDN